MPKITRFQGATYAPVESEEAQPSVGNSSLTSGEQPAKNEQKNETENQSPATKTERRSSKDRKVSSIATSVDGK